MRKLLPFLTLATMLVLLVATHTVASDSDTAIFFDQAKTRVGMSKVKLRISETEINDRRLKAVYRLSNLFLQPKHDVGTLRLELDQPLDRLLETGGSLMGRAHSSLTGKRYVVHCRLLPDGTARIDFQMGARLVTFKTHYRVTG